MSNGEDKSGAGGEQPFGTVGNYRILKFLGGGGMGKVFLAEHVEDGHKVALKTIRSNYHADIQLLKRFYNEARMAARLKHPNIVPVLSAFKDQGIPFMVMPYLEGGTLGVLLHQRTRLPWGQAMKVGGQVAAGLEFAHSQDITHRDIKPDNIFLDREGRVRILDFGLARLNQGGAQLTLPGMVIGTPAYMSPEQCAGKTATPPSDVYALGVVLYESLAGVRPFDGENPLALSQKIIMELAPPLEEQVEGLPADVVWLVNNMMQKSAEQRLTAEGVGEAIRKILAGEKLTASSDMVAALDSLRSELTSGLPKVDSGLSLKTPSLVDGVDFAQKTPAGISALHPKKPANSIWRMGSRWVMALLILAGAGWGGYYAYKHSSQTSSLGFASATLDSTFRNMSPDIFSILVNDPGMTYRPLGWAGDTSRLFIYGRNDGAATEAGSQSIGAIDLDSKSVIQLNFDLVEPRFPSPVLPPSDPGSPFYGCVTYFRSHENSAGLGRYREFVRQAATDAASTTVFRADPTKSHAHDDRFLQAMMQNAIVRADGKRLCLMLYDGKSKTTQLAERNLSATPEGKIEEPFYEAEGSLKPYGYSPSGKYVAFYGNIKDKRIRRTRVMVAAPGDKNTPARDVGPSMATAAQAAFHPSAEVLLVSFIESGQKSQLFTADVSKGAVEPVYLGEGRLGAHPWHPSGKYFVCTAPDSRGDAQLFAVYPATGERVQLTGPLGVAPLIAGIAPTDGASLSDDGEWLAIRLRNKQILCARVEQFMLK